MQVELNSYPDIGEYLREVRESMNYDVRDVAYYLNIRAKYLIALEAGDMNAIPGKVYARGYLQHYAEFLGLDKTAISNAFDRMESGGKTHVRFFVPEPRSKRYQPGIILVALILVTVGSIYYYWYETHKAIILPPEDSAIVPLPERLINPMRKVVGIPQNDDVYVPLSLPQEPDDRSAPAEEAVPGTETGTLPVVDENAVPVDAVPKERPAQESAPEAQADAILPAKPAALAPGQKIPTRIVRSRSHATENYNGGRARSRHENPPQQQEIEALPWLKEPRIRR